MLWQEAMDFAARINASVPSREELNQMYQARNEGALKGTFNTTGSHPAGWYWSSSQTTCTTRGRSASATGTRHQRQEQRILAALRPEMNPFDHLVISGLTAPTRRKENKS